MMENIIQRGEYEWELPIGSVPDMRVPGRFYLSQQLMGTLEEGALRQLANIATLPGICRHSLAMPDIHWGYGFPIGGVGAFTMDEGIISPGGVGFDINCGVRLIATPLHRSDLNQIKSVLQELYKTVPTGIGTKSCITASDRDLNRIMTEGAGWAVDEGYGTDHDLLWCEEQGHIEGADISHVSQKARKRGRPQCGTLGSGNHFLEIQCVEEIFDPEAARAFGIEAGQICIMIHCGSRGLGHQICTDHLKTLEDASKKYHIPLADKQLACAPLTSPEGEAYLSAMACAANYAWANRQVITYLTRQVFSRAFSLSAEEMPLVYDVTHNVAKIEEHMVDGKRTTLCVHRKGATRAFGPGTHDLPPGCNTIGQPVIIPGSMGSSSYLLKGTEGAMEKTFGSTCHGAGRVLSRSQAKKLATGESVQESLGRRGITVLAPSAGSIAEEAPDAYKPSGEVVRVVHEAGISAKVARLNPIGVIKG
ncbi:RtcB family protein [Methanogenium sp. MK-MG]|uniref:RtcB family protein n=1 Tax=Methanogenium sp. MK-MG TaxID=2599926 RepID=UPI0013E9AB26|nr:RtcB family protein [Methanogenium sp. MK-MG]KAF1076939.1 tRNA-splicing ligase RtcB [Methanogenium sp. MK-MG]